jgi:ATP-dependent RNA helicase DDX31/DBP7
MILNIQQESEENASMHRQSNKALKGSWKKRHLHKKKLKTIQEKEKSNLNKPIANAEQSKISHTAEPKKLMPAKNQHHIVSQLWSHNSAPEFSGTKSLELKPSVNPLIDNASFKDLGIDDLISQHLKEKLNISQPTPIQSKVIPQFLTCTKDILMQAQTGSGKSLAFLLPVMNQLLKRGNLGRDAGTLGLILAPTRELASQLFGVLGSLVKLSAPGKHWIVPGLLIGGEKKKSVNQYGFNS